MSYVVGECLKVAQMSLFTYNYGSKFVSLEEFISIQNQTSNIVSFLRCDFIIIFYKTFKFAGLETA